MAGSVEANMDAASDMMEMSVEYNEYAERHNIRAASVLTIRDDEMAGAVTRHLEARIVGKTVVEIGGGIGLLACHMGTIAKRVYCIEANPMWAWTFAGSLLQSKPRNVSFLFGAADEFVGMIKADVAVYCTHSDVVGMGLVASQFAPTVIDVYGELIAEHPDSFDPLASELRKIA